MSILPKQGCKNLKIRKTLEWRGTGGRLIVEVGVIQLAIGSEAWRTATAIRQKPLLGEFLPPGVLSLHLGGGLLRHLDPLELLLELVLELIGLDFILKTK